MILVWCLARAVSVLPTTSLPLSLAG
jgi:hypothetical protein